jgi:hypothetical protein
MSGVLLALMSFADAGAKAAWGDHTEPGMLSSASNLERKRQNPLINLLPLMIQDTLTSRCRDCHTAL